MDYREVKALQRDPEHARGIAQYLFKLSDIEWTDWELDFLENMSDWQHELSTRQGEKLIQLRDAAMLYEKVEGFSLKTLVHNCFASRLDLSESDQDFVERRKLSGATKFRRREAARILRCARTIGLIETYHGCTLDPPAFVVSAAWD
jgi:hypothetical protein